MKPFLLAFQFLTAIPIRIEKIKTKHIVRSLIWFPAAGIFLGSLLIFVNAASLSLGFTALPTDIFLVIALVVFTGGLHMDGLADTCDAFFSGKDKEEMLQIMRDSRIGTMGALGVSGALLLKIALLVSISGFLLPYALLLMCTLSRWALVMLIFCFPYARTEGKARIFIEGVTIKIFLMATAVALVSLVLIPGITSILIMSFIAMVAYAFGVICRQKIGGMTGDTFGAATELLEIMTLAAVLAAQKGRLL